MCVGYCYSSECAYGFADEAGVGAGTYGKLASRL